MSYRWELAILLNGSGRCVRPRLLTITLMSDSGSSVVWVGERGCLRKGFDEILAFGDRARISGRRGMARGNPLCPCTSIHQLDSDG